MDIKKPIAVFDIDGTIFRSSLLIELNAKLVHAGIFPEKATEKVMQVRNAWLDRTGSYKDYIDTIVELFVSDIKGKKVRDVQQIARELIDEQKHRVYTFTRDLIHSIRRSHVLILISFSPVEVVEAFNSVYHFDIAKGIGYAYRGGVFTGELEVGTEFDKTVILQKLLDRYSLSLKKSIGVGDTEYDIDFLKMVDRPIAFNPNRELYTAAKHNGWEVVVERKDVVYKIEE